MSFKAHKTLTAYAAKAGGKPDEGQLTAINQFTLDELGEDQVYVRTAYLAHSGIDRDRDAFEKALLDDFAKTLPGKGLFVKHPGSFDGDTGPGVGRWFEAKVVKVSQDEARKLLREPKLAFPEDGDAYLLEASYYLPRSGKNVDLIADIDAGVASDVSIGFAASHSTAITKDGDGDVIAYRVHAPGEALEGSLVWLGAQPGARTVKNYDKGQQALIDDDETEGNAVDLKDQLKEVQNKNTDLEKQIGTKDTTIAELKPKAENFDALAKTASGDEKAPAGYDDVLMLVSAGKAYLDDMVETIIKSERLNEKMKDDQKAIDEAKAFYRRMPLKLLQSKYSEAKAALPQGDQIDGSEPNGQDKAAGKSGLRDASVTRKAVGQDKAA